MNLSANLSRSTPIVDTRALRGVQLLLLAGLLLEPSIARAQFGGGMPWEGPIQQLVASLTGPVAKGVGIVAIVGLGFAIAFSEGGSTMRKALWVVMGLAITFSATTWALPFLGYMG